MGEVLRGIGMLILYVVVMGLLLLVMAIVYYFIRTIDFRYGFILFVIYTMCVSLISGDSESESKDLSNEKNVVS